MKAHTIHTWKLRAGWLAGWLGNMQNTAIDRLMSDHAPDISQLISDPHAIKWSNCIRKAMVYHFDNTLTKESHALLTPQLLAQLNAHHVTVLKTTHNDAAQDSHQTYYARLELLNTEALSKAEQAYKKFLAELQTKFHAKQEDAQEAAHHDLSAFKYALTIKSNAWKAKANKEVTRSIVHTAKSSTCSGCKAKRIDPISRPPSCSISRATSRAPSPTPSIPALDKTPTKADFATGMKVDELALPVQPMISSPSETYACSGSMVPEMVAATHVRCETHPLGVVSHGEHPLCIAPL